MVTIDATVGGVAANSYATQAEVDAYFASRLPLAPPWEDAEDPTATIVMATRTFSSMFTPGRTLVTAQGSNPAYYRTRRQWTGLPATTTQRLAWPRTGMYDANGNAIASNVIPQALKDALAEFAGQLLKSDRTLDNDVIVQGLTSIRAGSVSLSFKETIAPQVLPDAVVNLMPPSWFTDELVEPAAAALFEVI